MANITGYRGGNIINFKRIAFDTLKKARGDISPFEEQEMENFVPDEIPEPFYEYSLPSPLAKLPAVTFRVENQDISQELDGQWELQECKVVVDFWASTSRDAGAISRAYIASLIDRGWRLETTTPVPNPDSDIWHINAVFILRVRGDRTTREVLENGSIYDKAQG